MTHSLLKAAALSASSCLCCVPALAEAVLDSSQGSPTGSSARLDFSIVVPGYATIRIGSTPTPPLSDPDSATPANRVHITTNAGTVTTRLLVEPASFPASGPQTLASLALRSPGQISGPASGNDPRRMTYSIAMP